MRIGYVFTLWRYPYINSKTSPGALFLWEAWEVISGAKVLLFFHICKCFVLFFRFIIDFIVDIIVFEGILLFLISDT